MKLSIVIPAHNEAQVIGGTLRGIVDRLVPEELDYEVIVVDDASSDGTTAVVADLTAENPRIQCLRKDGPHGFGYAVRRGLEAFSGDAVAIVMADGSDDPRDVILSYRVLQAGTTAPSAHASCRAVVKGYPRLKLTVNRIVNLGIRLLFRHGYSDTTNAFNAYRREVIEVAQPLVSPHFNLTVELP